MKKEISTFFNVKATTALWLISFVIAFTTHEVTPAYESKTVLETFVHSLAAQVIFLMVSWIVSALVIAALFKQIWNRLITDVVQLRQISFNEAYALSILLTWVVWL
ncbi:hypothetical protein [Pseudoalteromonas piscicida]|uniref:hypothetical protein n=1 Tax=Pseudoalteromonas piscicida TaxID=43662 RepID=UPI00117AF97D|nr:hypothetical protein [Pseudoalteromonas piscicida]